MCMNNGYEPSIRKRWNQYLMPTIKLSRIRAKLVFFSIPLQFEILKQKYMKKKWFIQ